MNSQDQQLFTLDNETKTKLGASKIHGVGVFAIKDIQKGEKLYLLPPKGFMNEPPPVYNLPHASLKKLRPEVKELILDRWPAVINGSHFIAPNDMAVLCTFVNHSEEPNYEISTDKALKDIRAGEEVVQNYRLMENYEKIYTWLN